MKIPLLTLPVIFVALLSGCELWQSDPQSEKWWTENERRLIISELNRTTLAVRVEIEDLSYAQWNFRESPDRWSIAEIIEHLEMQNQLHYRELSVIANAPQYVHYRVITNGNDQHFVNYATDTIKGQANWFLQPLGKFCSKEDGEKAFYRARRKLTEYVEQTEADLRKQFTFRSPVYEKDITQLRIGEVRDLHQLLLTGIAHTDRHLTQIRKVKTDPAYPR